MKRSFFFICILLQIPYLYSQSHIDEFDELHQVIELCEFGNYTFSEMKSPENMPSVNSCLPEDNFSGAVSWIKFPIDQPGYLEFTLTPKYLNHDLDFELYNVRFDTGEIPGSLVRCNANGANLGEGILHNEICLGTTGMKTQEQLIFQYAGCTDVISNFVIPAYTKKDEVYYLKVINQSGINGFDLQLGGTTSIHQGQEIDFTYTYDEETFQYEFTPVLTDKREELEWDFGIGAVVIAEKADGKIIVQYDVEGSKTIILTNSGYGCLKQAEKEIEVMVVKNNEEQQTTLAFPNPVINALNISFETPQEGAVDILLHSANGSILYHHQKDLASGKHNHQIDCSGLVAGTYIVEIKSPTQSQYQKIVKLGNSN